MLFHGLHSAIYPASLGDALPRLPPPRRHAVHAEVGGALFECDGLRTLSSVPRQVDHARIMAGSWPDHTASSRIIAEFEEKVPPNDH